MEAGNASPVPAYTVLGLFGSTAMAPTAKEGCESVSGTQLWPPSVVFHTPPPAVPAYTMLSFVGSSARASTRPALGTTPSRIALGPMDVQGKLLRLGP